MPVSTACQTTWYLVKLFNIVNNTDPQPLYSQLYVSQVSQLLCFNVLLMRLHAHRKTQVFFLAIVLSVLRFTYSDYPVSIFKFFFLFNKLQVIKFTSCLPRVGGSLRVPRLPPPLKTGRHDIAESGVKRKKKSNSNAFVNHYYKH